MPWRSRLDRRSYHRYFFFEHGLHELTRIVHKFRKHRKEQKHRNPLLTFVTPTESFLLWQASKGRAVLSVMVLPLRTSSYVNSKPYHITIVITSLRRKNRQKQMKSRVVRILDALWQFCRYVFVPQRRPTDG